MDYSLSIHLGVQNEVLRRQSFIDLLACWPTCSENFRLRELSVASLIEWQNGEPLKHSLPLETPLDTIRRECLRDPRSDRILLVDALWDAWKRSRDAIGRSEYQRVPSCLSVDYFGSEAAHSGGDMLLASEFGDIAVNFRPHIVELSPYKAAQRMPPDELSCQQENLNVFLEFLTDVLQQLTPRDARLIESVYQRDGSITAAAVFHQDPRDFVRDLLRALLVMNEFVTVQLNVLSKRSDRLRRHLTYFSPVMKKPETLITSEMGQLLAAKCQSLQDRDRLLAASPLICIPLVRLCEVPDKVHNWLSMNRESEILDVLNSHPEVELSEIGAGWLLTTSPFGNGNLQRVYEDLLLMVAS